MSTLTDPSFAYLLFMASLGLLYFEMTHAGVVRGLGEMWKFESKFDQKLGDRVRVIRQTGLTLVVEPVSETK